MNPPEEMRYTRCEHCGRHKALNTFCTCAYGQLAAEAESLRVRVQHLEAERAEYDPLLTKQADLLTRTVNVLKGPPPDLVWWSHHDIPELAEAVVQERDTLKAQAEHLVGIPSRWALYGLWLIEKTGGCTCGSTSQEPHGPECGVEPIMDLSTLEGWEDLRKAALAHRRPDGGGTKAEVWVVQEGSSEGAAALVLIAASKEGAMRHLAIYCGVDVTAIKWEQRHSIFDSQEYWVATHEDDEFHLQAYEVEA